MAIQARRKNKNKTKKKSEKKSARQSGKQRDEKKVEEQQNDYSDRDIGFSRVVGVTYRESEKRTSNVTLTSHRFF